MSTHNLCFEQEYEKYQNFYLKIFIFFLLVKFSVYLNRRVFVMKMKIFIQQPVYYTGRVMLKRVFGLPAY